VIRNFAKPILAVLMVVAVAQPPAALGLINLDGTRNQIFVFGQASFGYDSNVFAENVARDDYTITGSVGAELKRRAGIISVNARATLDYLHFRRFSEQSAWNPNFLLEFDKANGRTTGSLTLNAFRASKADSAVNLRTESWNIPVSLNLKYPVNDKVYLTSQTGYLRRTFPEVVTLADYTDYTQALDMFYVFSSKLDLVGGYRARFGDTPVQGRTTDHEFSVGATGGLFAKVNGSLRAGYQVREIDRTGETFDHATVSAALTWNATRKLSVALQATRDFNTTALGTSVASTSTMLRSTYVFTRRFQIEGGAGHGRNKFVGREQPSRRDDFVSWELSATYIWNEHLRVGGSFLSLSNYSTLGFADFDRHTYTLDIATRW
jgi:hypothetical protein